MKTLLKTMQLILSSMDSDEVNDIYDTVESRQVLDIIEQTYTDISSQIALPEFFDFFSLNPSLDPAKPTQMSLPANVSELVWFKYNVADEDDTIRKYHDVNPLSRKEFFGRMDGFDTEQTDVFRYDYVVDGTNFDVRGKTNKNPDWYTTSNNRTIFIDSFNFGDGHTAVAARTWCYGKMVPEFIRENDWVLPMDASQYTLFFNEAKAQCFIELKQVENAKAERNARRGWNSSQRKKEITQVGSERGWVNDYGRKGKF